MLLRGRGILVSEKAVSGAQPQLHVLTAETEWEAAENVARWLACGDNTKTAVVCSDHTSVLDHYLADRGLPRLGVGASSSWRANDQIIPLFFEVIWGPINVRLLAEFLSLPGTPVKRPASGYLLQALKQAPGTGSEAWFEALDKIADHQDLGPSWASDIDQLFNTSLIDGDTAPGSVLVQKAAWLTAQLRRLAKRKSALLPTVEQLLQVIDLLSTVSEVSEAGRATNRQFGHHTAIELHCRSGSEPMDAAGSPQRAFRRRRLCPLVGFQRCNPYARATVGSA